MVGLENPRSARLIILSIDMVKENTLEPYGPRGRQAGFMGPGIGYRVYALGFERLPGAGVTAGPGAWSFTRREASASEALP